MRIPRLLFRPRDITMALNGITSINVGVGHSRAGRFDRIVPAVGLVQVGESATVPVVQILRRVGDQRNALPQQSLFREVGSLRSPAADGVAGFLCFWCVDSQEPHAKSTPNIVANVDGVTVNNFQHDRRGVHWLCRHGRR